MVEMGQRQKITMETEFRRPVQVKDGGEKTRKSRWSVGANIKKGDGCSGRVFGKFRPSESGY